MYVFETSLPVISPVIGNNMTGSRAVTAIGNASVAQ